MQYELISGAGVGVIIDPTPILRDIKDTFGVSFVLPDVGAYVALFRDEAGVEYRATIKGSVAKVPKQILTKNQRIGLTVCKVDGDEITRSWECHPLKVGSFLELRKTQWQITAGMDDRELYARLAEIEKTHARTQAEFNELKAENLRRADEFAQTAREYAESVNGLTKALASVKTANETLANGYNEAIKVVNDLTGRVAALEKNYDPTIIK